MKATSAILLAAGESKRMGELNKLTLTINNIPLLLHAAIRLLAADINELVVVVGHEEDTARKILAGLPLNIVSNPNFTNGQMTSVHVGLNALKRPCDSVMICLSDQPKLEVSDYNQLLHAYQSDCHTPILIPLWRKKRGNPIIIDTEQKDIILENNRNLGCKYLTRNYPELVTSLEMGNDHFVTDIDTPEDYKKLQKAQQKGAKQPR